MRLGLHHRQANNFSTSARREEEVRFSLDINVAFGQESMTELGRLFHIWQRSGRSVGGARYWKDLQQNGGMALEGWLYASLIDVALDDPYNFFVTRHARRGVFPNYERRFLREIKSDMNLDSIAMEYTLAKERAAPQYDEIHQWSGNDSRHYARAIFPFCDVAGKVKYLLFATRPITDVVPLNSSLQVPVLLR